MQDIDDRAERRTYLAVDRESRQTLIIDSVVENVAHDLRLIKKLGLTLRYVGEAHIHADHITDASPIKDAGGAQIADALEGYAQRRPSVRQEKIHPLDAVPVGV